MFLSNDMLQYYTVTVIMSWGLSGPLWDMPDYSKLEPLPQQTGALPINHAPCTMQNAHTYEQQLLQLATTFSMSRHIFKWVKRLQWATTSPKAIKSSMSSHNSKLNHHISVSYHIWKRATTCISWELVPHLQWSHHISFELTHLQLSHYFAYEPQYL